MQTALAALLHGIIDDAALFPPAKLDLDPAIRAFAAHRHGPMANCVARFICPAARLADLGPYRASVLAQGPAFHFSVLATAPAQREEVKNQVAVDVARLRAFVEQHAGRVHVDAIEIRLPDDLVESASESDIASTTAWVAETFSEALPDGPNLAVEAGLARSWPERTRLVARALAAATHSSGVGCGFKLRTGGLVADAFPTCQRIAHTLASCLEAGVTFKATAGLHHPVRRDAPELGATMHGFFNVFGAGVLIHAGSLDAAAAEAMLEDRDPASFVFTNDAFAWHGHSVGIAAIERARRELVTSFGSCSVDEPREDLQALGLL